MIYSVGFYLERLHQLVIYNSEKDDPLSPCHQKHVA